MARQVRQPDGAEREEYADAGRGVFKEDRDGGGVRLFLEETKEGLSVRRGDEAFGGDDEDDELDNE